MKEEVMKIKIILSLFILIFLIPWVLQGCKKSAVEPEDNTSSGKIAFYSYRDGNYEVYIMNGDGSNQINLTKSEGFDGYPVFSPDGSKIAFCSDRDGNGEIYIMNGDGSNQINLTKRH
jgi:Tol biopolymer transport system component